MCPLGHRGPIHALTDSSICGSIPQIQKYSDTTPYDSSCACHELYDKLHVNNWLLKEWKEN
jgi:hypothetical protein